MKTILLTLMLLTSCSKQSYEMEELSKDVIKSKQGVEIEVLPLPKQ